MQTEKDTQRYWQLEEKRIDEGLQNRSGEEWTEVIHDQGIYLRDYLCLCLTRTVQKMRDRANFAEKLVYQGKRIYSDEAVVEHRREADEYDEIRKKISDAPHFIEILPLLREKFGTDTTFRSFLEALNPTHRQEDDI